MNKTKLYKENFMFGKFLDKAILGKPQTDEMIYTTIKGVFNFLKNTQELKNIFKNIGFRFSFSETPKKIYSVFIDGKEYLPFQAIDFLHNRKYEKHLYKAGNDENK